MSFVYKVCSIEEWNKASEKGIYEGSQEDLEDGFIHLSTKKQLKETILKRATHTGLFWPFGKTPDNKSKLFFPILQIL